MADQKDNYIRTEDKARWGFGGSAAEITVGVGSKDDGEKSLTAKLSKDDTGKNNGGGDNPLADKTVPQLKVHAEENRIDLGGATKKADVLAAIAAGKPDFNLYSDDELKAFAQQSTIDLGDATERADIVATIELAREQ